LRRLTTNHQEYALANSSVLSLLLNPDAGKDVSVLASSIQPVLVDSHSWRLHPRACNYYI